MKCSKCGREIRELVKVEKVFVERRSRVILKDGKLVELDTKDQTVRVVDRWYECRCGALITDSDAIVEAILEGKSAEEVLRIFVKVLSLREALR